MITVRDAGPADNAELLRLTAACPMEGAITMCVEREPDFFALNRLEGDVWRVGVADLPGHPVAGCAAVALRRVNLCGRAQTIAYASDLKVHPLHRGGGVALALLRWGSDVCREFGGADIPVLSTVLAGNRAMERMTEGRHGRLPAWVRFATIRAHAIPLFVPRRVRDAGLRIAPATAGDVDAMLALWSHVAPRRQFSPILGAGEFLDWVGRTPGLALDDYWLAWHPGGRLAGFLGVWVQDSIKRLRVHVYSRRLAVARVVINLAGAITRSAPLPPPGKVLRTATVLHPCIAEDDPAVLHALLRRVYRSLRARRFGFFTLGLDRRDPLTPALRGLLGQPTDVHAYITTPAGHWPGPALDSRPFYYDVALV